jgi:hypothetical protein
MNHQELLYATCCFAEIAKTAHQLYDRTTEGRYVPFAMIYGIQAENIVRELIAKAVTHPHCNAQHYEAIWKSIRPDLELSEILRHQPETVRWRTRDTPIPLPTVRIDIEALNMAYSTVLIAQEYQYAVELCRYQTHLSQLPTATSLPEHALWELGISQSVFEHLKTLGYRFSQTAFDKEAFLTSASNLFIALNKAPGSQFCKQLWTKMRYVAKIQGLLAEPVFETGEEHCCPVPAQTDLIGWHYGSLANGVDVDVATWYVVTFTAVAGLVNKKEVSVRTDGTHP